MLILLCLILLIITIVLFVRELNHKKRIELQIQEASLEIENLHRRISELESAKTMSSNESSDLKNELFQIALNINLYCQLALAESETISLKEKHYIIIEESQKILDKLQAVFSESA